MKRTPPDILITTPESLYLMITSQVREILTGVEAVIVDEIHAVAQSKRGSHLALTLERLSHLAAEEGNPEPQRIGLSATQRPLERIAEFLVGPHRECEIVNAGVRKDLDLEIVVPVDDMTQPAPTESLDPVASLEREPITALDLAGDLPGAARARPRAHLDDHLRQQPPRRRTPRQAPQRAPQRDPRHKSSPQPSTAGNHRRGPAGPRRTVETASRRSPEPTTAPSPTKSA